MIKPINNNVLIRVEKIDDKTASGIYLPDTRLKERPSEGIVEAVRKGAIIKVGDKILFVKHGQFELKEEHKIIIQEEDILAIIT